MLHEKLNGRHPPGPIELELQARGDKDVKNFRIKFQQHLKEMAELTGIPNSQERIVSNLTELAELKNRPVEIPTPNPTGGFSWTCSIAAAAAFLITGGLVVLVWRGRRSSACSLAAPVGRQFLTWNRLRLD